jgi:hypothetical protein
MKLILPHQLSKRDLLFLVASIGMVVLCVVILDGYRASQADRIGSSSPAPAIIISPPDMSVFERLKKLR